MNKQRRNTIGRIISDLENVKSEIENAGQEEQDYADNMPENMQYTTPVHERAEEVAQELDEIAQEITDLVDRLQEVTQ